MKEQSTERVLESRPVWEGLEAFARHGVQDLLQRMLEEEVAAMLGRRRYARREGIDAAAGYRNGYGKPRRLSLSVGRITLRRPRVRALTERFESQLLPLFKRRTETVGQLLPQLYLHGLALGDFDLALRGLLGDGAPLSAASVARLKAGWQAEYELWRTRSLADLEVERWFALLTEKQLRRGVHRSTRELEAAIDRYLTVYNEAPKPFVWTNTADEILASVARFCHRISDSGH
jgi:transposase-like protein